MTALFLMELLVPHVAAAAVPKQRTLRPEQEVFSTEKRMWGHNLYCLKVTQAIPGFLQTKKKRGLQVRYFTTLKQYAQAKFKTYSKVLKRKIQKQIKQANSTCAVSLVRSCQLVANSLQLTAIENSPISFQFTANDSCNRSIDFHITSQPMHGSLTGEPPFMSYEPESHRVTQDNFSFEAKAGDDVVSASVSIQFSSASANFAGRADSLAPYRNNITLKEVRRLLNKVAWGGTKQLEAIGVTQGLDALVEALITLRPSPDVEDDALHYASTAFVHYPDAPTVDVWEEQSTENYWLYLMIFSENPFFERMALFWHTHFAVNLHDVNFPSATSFRSARKAYVDLLRRNPFGKFVNSQPLTNEDPGLMDSMIWDKSMNYWLNNIDNTASSPNQNFGREIMELFMLGPSDPIMSSKRNYGQDSVVAATAFLSGFKSVLGSGVDAGQIQYDPIRHDTNTYSVFPESQGAYVAAAAFTHDSFPEHIFFNHEGSPRFLGERLFAQLVTPDVPARIVDELARDLLMNGSDFEPIVRKILRSSAMFAPTAQAVCVTSPVEFFMKLLRKLELRESLSDHMPEPSEDPVDRTIVGGMNSVILRLLRDALKYSGQLPLEPPSVFAWNECGTNRQGIHAYGETWLNTMLLARQNGLNYLSTYLTRANPGSCMDPQQSCSWMHLIPQMDPSLSDAQKAGILLDHFAQDIFGIEISDYERNQIIYYLTHFLSCNGSVCTPFDASFDLSGNTPESRVIIISKLTGLFEIFATMTINNLR